MSIHLAQMDTVQPLTYQLYTLHYVARTTGRIPSTCKWLACSISNICLRTSKWEVLVYPGLYMHNIWINKSNDIKVLYIYA